jgi:hypothetical protein
MKAMILAAFAALTLSLGVAKAATVTDHSPAQQGNNYNFLQGGGG